MEEAAENGKTSQGYLGEKRGCLAGLLVTLAIVVGIFCYAG
jgi:hypothetical protein